MNLLLLLYCASSQGLRIAEDRVRASDKMPELCKDDETDPIVTPVLQNIVDYYKQKNFTLYPGAVSSIGSLRYGGNSVLLNGKRHQLDHDVDLLAIGPPGSTLDPVDKDFQLLQHDELVKYLMKEKGREFAGVNMEKEAFTFAAAYTRVEQKGLLDKNGKKYGFITVRVSSPPNALQHRFEEQEPLLGISHLVELASQTSFEHIVESGAKVARSFYTFLKPSLHPPSEPSSPWVQYDIFFRSGTQDALQPHLTKKVLFHGIPFRAPADAVIFTDVLSMAFWHKGSEAGKKVFDVGICSFSLPETCEGFEDDMPNTQENIEVARRCASALQAHGYVSFNQCLGNKMHY